MPDPTPTTDKKGRISKKTALIALGAGGLLGLALYIRNKKRKEGTTAGTEGTPYTSQAFIPVTAENVGGVGATGGGGGTMGGEGSGFTALIQAQKENNEFITNILKSEREGREASNRENQEFLHGLIGSIGAITGGGAPTGGQIGTGGGTASPPSGGTPAAPPPPPGPPPAPASCSSGHGDFNKYNPAYGPPSSHSCYKYSRDRCPPPKIYKHVYQDGKVICASG